MASFNQPGGIAADASGNLYVADTNNNTIRKVTSAGVVTTLAGAATVRGSADGVGAAASFNGPAGIAVDTSGNVYVADAGNDTIRKISLFGAVTTLAGSPGQAGSSDGSGVSARFNDPLALAVDQAGNIDVCDTLNATIRRVTASGTVTTIAGSPQQYGSVDGQGSAARFLFLRGIAIDASGNIYVSDAGGASFAGMVGTNTIRKIATSGVVSTLAGTPGPIGSSDGMGPAARFDNPGGLVPDTSGNIYVADTSNFTIRGVSPAGVVVTLAGAPGQLGSTDGTGSQARFANPSAIALSGSTLYITDGSNTIRAIR